MMVFLLFLTSALFFSSQWAFEYFGLSCFEQIPFHLKVSLEGTNTEFIFDWIKMCGSKSLLLTTIVWLIIQLLQLPSYQNELYIALCLLLLFAAATRIGLFSWIIHQFCSTDIYEKFFVDPKDVKISFPNKKRNLIYVYVESLETTYTSKENGGDYNKDLIPELSSLANDYINFSHGKKMGGAHMVPGTGWTTGGIVAQSAGVGLTIPLTSPRWKQDQAVLKHLTTLGDILQKEGYQQEFCIGSDATFGGRKNYFLSHGNYKIWDTNTAKDQLPENYHVFWGYEDKKLFEFAKQQITKLSQDDKPFNFQMLTVDTHHPRGYLDENVESIFPERLSNIIHYESKQLGAFIEWIQNQDFYKNTTIIISGDHTSMASQYIQSTFDKFYDRTTLNIVINSPIQPIKEKSRQFTSFDLFPTTIASLGATIEGDRLGFGTNLFSKKKTLIERKGLRYLQKELCKQSKYYWDKIL